MKVGGVKTPADAPPRAEPGEEQSPLETNPLTSATSTPSRSEGFKSPSVLRIEPENPVKANIGTASPHCLNDADADSVETISVKFLYL